VIFRLEDDADQQIYAKHCVDAFSLYQSLSELLKHLKEIYEDQNLIRKCRREYVALKQLNKLFSSFYSEFTRIFSFLNYDDVILMNDIQNKINNRLQNALSVCLIKFSSLDKLKIFLQDVNNKQRVNYQLRDECYDSSYASMLIAMLMTMLMTIVDRSSLDYRVVPRSILFRVSLCSSESYR